MLSRYQHILEKQKQNLFLQLICDHLTPLALGYVERFDDEDDLEDETDDDTTEENDDTVVENYDSDDEEVDDIMDDVVKTTRVPSTDHRNLMSASLEESDALRALSSLSNRPTESYVTLCISDDMIGSVLVLALSLRDTGCIQNACLAADTGVYLSTSDLSVVSNKNLTVMVSPMVTKSGRQTLEDAGLVLAETEFLRDVHPKLALISAKLQMFLLEQYERCVFLSPACRLFQNIDYLFHLDGFCASKPNSLVHRLDPRLIVFTPSAQAYECLLQILMKRGYEVGDRVVLEEYFNEWYPLLPDMESPRVISATTNTILF